MTDTLTEMLDGMGRYTLLKPDEEIQLGHQVQAWMGIRDKDHLTPEEEAIARDGARAYRKLYQCNLRLAFSVAKKSFRLIVDKPAGLEPEDLVQEACIGLGRAIEKFDPTRGYKFSTYAYWWLRQAVSRAIDQTSTTVRLPYGWRAEMHKISRTIQEHKRTHGRHITTDSLAEATGVHADRIQAYSVLGRRVASLDMEVGMDESNLVSLIPSTDAPLLDQVAGQDAKERLVKAMGRLDAESRHLVELYYGFDGQGQRSQTELGRMLGKSRETARKVLYAAITQLRQEMSAA